MGGARRQRGGGCRTGVVEDGKAFVTIGTSGVVFAHTNEMAIDPKGRVHTFCCAVPGLLACHGRDPGRRAEPEVVPG